MIQLVETNHYPPKFEDFVAPARAKSALWRVVVGIALLVALLFGAMYGALYTLEKTGVPLGFLSLENLSRSESAHALLFVLFGLAMICVLLPIVTLLLHRRGLRSLIGPKVRGQYAWIWGAIAAILVGGAVTLASTAVVGFDGVVWQGMLDGWAVYAIAGAVLVFFQASAEELVFRGYIVQQLVVRFRAPLIWGFIPAVLFGVLHYDAELPLTIRVGYVLLTISFGILMTYSVYRTGSLHFAFGFHVVNNWLALLIIGPSDSAYLTALTLWLTPTAHVWDFAICFVAELAIVVAVVEGAVMRHERLI